MGLDYTVIALIFWNLLSDCIHKKKNDFKKYLKSDTEKICFVVPYLVVFYNLRK